MYSRTPATIVPYRNDGAGNKVESGSKYVVEDKIEDDIKNNIKDEVEDRGAEENDALLEDNNRPQRKSKRRHLHLFLPRRHGVINHDAVAGLYQDGHSSVPPQLPVYSCEDLPLDCSEASSYTHPLPEAAKEYKDILELSRAI